MNKELTQEEAALLWAQKKRVQAMNADSPGLWGDIVPISSSDGVYWPTVFSKTKESYRYRLASEPPAKRYRAWRMEEVPIGAQIRFPDWDDGERLLICGTWRGKVMWATPVGFVSKSPEVLLNQGWEHSIDNGKTRLPCGVEVEA